MPANYKPVSRHVFVDLDKKYSETDEQHEDAVKAISNIKRNIIASFRTSVIARSNGKISMSH